ncbi:hypothetical protein, partial [Ensifer sp. 4252]|uniref:hypothetical protein n=1 Tax=Ensifer sp. 4252 TaxID=3373915 RepID=UPI003D20B3CA
GRGGDRLVSGPQGGKSRRRGTENHKSCHRNQIKQKARQVKTRGLFVVLRQNKAMAGWKELPDAAAGQFSVRFDKTRAACCRTRLQNCDGAGDRLSIIVTTNCAYFTTQDMLQRPMSVSALKKIICCQWLAEIGPIGLIPIFS